MRAFVSTKKALGVAALMAPVLALGFAAAPAIADSTHGAIAPPVRRAATQELRVPLDQAVPLRLTGAAGGVAVGNPSIAGVSVQNDQLLFVTGRSYGTTNLVVVDNDGRTIYSGRITVTADEANVVMVTRGAETSRLDCTPMCRPRPDIGDSATTYTAASEQITGRANAAASR